MKFLKVYLTNFTVKDTSVNDKVETIDLDGTIVLDSTVESDTEMEEVTQDINKEVKKDGKDTSGMNTPSISTPTRQHSSSSTGINVVSKTEPGKILLAFFCNIEILIIGYCFFLDFLSYIVFYTLQTGYTKSEEVIYV